MIIHLQNRRVQAAGLLQKLQHALAGFPLLMLGIKRFSEEGEMPIAILEIGIAALVLGTFAREIYAAGKNHASHAKIDYFDLAAAAMMMFEAFHGHHGKPPHVTPQFYASLATTGIALFHGKLHERRLRRRYVKLDENGLEARTGRFHRRFSLTWAEVDRIQIARDKAVIHGTDGKSHTIGLRMLGNREEVRKHISEHALAAGVAMNTLS
jgi:hypothetical protein